MVTMFTLSLHPRLLHQQILHDVVFSFSFLIFREETFLFSNQILVVSEQLSSTEIKKIVLSATANYYRRNGSHYTICRRCSANYGKV